MTKNTYYKEVQKFRQPWLWILLLFCLSILLYREEQTGVLIVAGISAILWVLKLETLIDDSGIAFRWLPFQRRHRLIKWATIDSISVRSYSALTEFGGWGMRISWNGTAQTISGNFGIEIRKKNKKRFLMIGTQNPHEVRMILDSIQASMLQ